MVNIVSQENLDQHIVHPGINSRLQTILADPNDLNETALSVQTDSFTDNYPPGYTPVNNTAIFSKTYKDDFYYKVRYLPLVLNIGSLTSAQTRELYVFNGFFESKTLEDLLLANGEGVTINGPAVPTSYSPLQLSLYSVGIDIDGPATIDATISFDWEVGVGDAEVRVFGSRSIGIPYLFQPETTEILSWKTDVITASDGTEKRIRVRKAPRQSININLSTPNGQSTILDNILYAWRGNVFALPMSTQCKISTVATSLISPNLGVNTDFADFRVGEIAVAYESENNFEIFQILSFTQTEIIADRNFTKVIPIGSLVMPAVSARMTSNPRRSFNGYSAGLSSSFVSLTNAELASSASPVQYNGLDVFLDEVFTQNENATDLYRRDVVIVDYDTGLEESFNPWINTKIDRTITIYMDSLEEVWNHRLWLHRRAGKHRPFYMPTHENNFNIISTGVIGATFDVVDEGQLTLTGNRLDVAIETTTGWLLAAILPPISQNGNFLSVTIDSAINLERELILGMSYLDRKRLSSDNVEITWLGNFTARSVLSLVNTD